MELLETDRSVLPSSNTGAAALVAADPGDPDRECVVGELVWNSELCDDLPCRCEWGYNGVASEGITMIAEVRRLPGVERRGLRGALVDRMRSHGYPPTIAASRADALLDLAGSLPVGTLLRLEHGNPVPFPPGSRLAGRGRVLSPAPKGLR